MVVIPKGNWMERLIRKNAYRVFLLSYFVILIIPVLLGSLSYAISAKSLKEQISQYNASMLEQVAQVIDSQIYSIDQMMSNIVREPQINAFLYSRAPLGPDDHYLMYKAINEISKYNSLNNMVRELYIYFSNSDSILTGTGKYDLKIYYDYYVASTGMTFEEWKGKLDEVAFKRYFGDRTQGDGVAAKTIIDVRQSLPLGERIKPLGMLGISIDSKSIRSLLGGIDSINRARIYIIDDAGRIILQSGEGIDAPKTLNEIRELKKGSYFIGAGQNEVLVSHQLSQYNKWDYITILPTSVFMEKLNWIRNLTIFIILSELLLGIILSVYMARRNYQPIKKLSERVGEKAGKAHGGKGNELDFIEEIADAAFLENSNIKQEMAMQQPLARSNILLQLLHGSSGDFNNIEKSMKSMGISPVGESFCVMVVRIDDSSEFTGDQSMESLALVRFVIKNVSQELIAEHYHSFDIDLDLYQVALIIDGIHGDEEFSPRIVDAAKRMSKLVAEEFLSHTTVGIGTPHMGIHGINASYNEAVKSLGYSVVRGRGAVISYAEVSHENKGYVFPASVEIQLINSIKAGDTEKVMEQLDEIYLSNFSSQRVTIELAMCLFFDMMSTGLKVLNDIDIDYDAVFKGELDPMDRILKCKTAMEMNNTLKAIYQKICQYISERKKSHNDILKGSIVEFIQSNYQDSSLSLTSVADQIGINPSYLSNFFKKQTGENFVDFLNKIRIEKASELLSSTQDSIFIISEQVGYTNYANLIRTFKRLKGITPGQFRSQIEQSKELKQHTK